MEDTQLREDFAKLALQVLALREVVSRLVSDSARASGDPEAVFQRFSGGADARIDMIRSIPSAEIVRDTVDRILADARQML